MELDILCSTWIREEDEKVLLLLQKSDRWLTVEEIVEATRLSPHHVRKTLHMLIRQRKDHRKLAAVYDM